MAAPAEAGTRPERLDPPYSLIEATVRSGVK
jgi:hypothetical protein